MCLVLKAGLGYVEEGWCEVLYWLAGNGEGAGALDSRGERVCGPAVGEVVGYVFCEVYV